MSRAEKAFWAGLLLAAGVVMGALIVSLSQSAKPANCDTGVSEQVEDGVRKKTYIPALDNCKK